MDASISWSTQVKWPPDALAVRDDIDVISPALAPTLPALFRERVRRNGIGVAYRQYEPLSGAWRDYSWNQTAQQVAHWMAALRSEGIEAGGRVAIRLRNCWQWVLFDQAALASGLVVVPIYVEDRAENIAYVIEQTEARLLFLEDQEQWRELAGEGSRLDSLQRVVTMEASESEGDSRLVSLDKWLAVSEDFKPIEIPHDGGELATIVFTSGTTGRPKGVMLSHRNILEDAWGGLHSVAVLPVDQFLSFLPLSHMFERTVGYYLPMMAGATVAFNRSIPELPEDLTTIRPTVMISVPRIFEKAYSKIAEQLEQGLRLKQWLFDMALLVGWQRFLHSQGRAAWHPQLLLWPMFKLLVAAKITHRFGGRLRLVVCGGAPLPARISKAFVSLGVPLLQGYGLTETSPVLTVNTLQNNRPTSIGQPLQGVDLRVNEKGELLARGAPVMLGYWRNEAATRGMIDQFGWLHTGDCARIEDGFVTLTGRIKEIVVLANGEKIPPADLESAISHDPLFEQAMVIGEGRPYLTALVVLNPRCWARIAGHLGVDPTDERSFDQLLIERVLRRNIARVLTEFPGYARIYRVAATLEPWLSENGLLTPTLKLKRASVHERYKEQIERMYEGH